MSRFHLQRYFCLFLIFIFTYTCLNGQNKILIDSLNSRAFELRYSEPETSNRLSVSAIHFANNDTLHSSFILSLRNAGISLFAMSEYDKAISFLQRALHISELISDSISLSASHNNLYMVYNTTGKTDLAKIHLVSSLEIDIALQDTAGIALNLNNLAEYYFLEGLINEAINLYMQSAKMELLMGNPPGAADSYNNIATVYAHNQNYDKCLYYHNKALAIYEEFESLPDIAMSLSNIAHTLSQMNKGDEALVYVNRSISIREYLDDKKGLAQSYMIKAIVLQNLKQYEEAEDLFFISMNLALEVGNYRQLATGFHYQAEFYISIQDTTRAIYYLQNCLEFAREISYRDMLISTLSSLTELFSGMGDFENAFRYHQELVQLLENKPSDLSVLKLRHEIVPDQEIIDKNRNLMFMFLSFFVVLSIILILKIISLRRKIKQIQEKQC